MRTVAAAGLIHTVYRHVFANPIVSFDLCRDLITGKIGLEIGGPSAIFRQRGLFPVYPLAARIDNSNFSARTIWEKSLDSGFQFDRRRPCGKQYFFEATDLSKITANSYDFLLSSHVLEHVANPISALMEWIRVTVPGGMLAIVVPHREGTFDHRRPVTALEHLIADFDRRTSEADTTHLAEILQLHDLSRDPEAGDIDAFRRRAENNLENRSLHHHVFDTALAVELIDYSGLQIIAVEAARPYHIFVVAQKLTDGRIVNNDQFRGSQAAYRLSSPFTTDRSG
jgi:SAM-dependent methyltransferase